MSPSTTITMPASNAAVTATYVASGSGNTYFVSTSGSDANSCTLAKDTDQTHQKRHIGEGVACLSAGDILYIHTGTYTSSADTIDTIAGTVASGTDFGSGAVTIGGFPGETVTLQQPDGVPSMRFASLGVNGAINVKYIIVQDLIVDGVNQTSLEVAAASFNSGSNHIRLQRLEVKNFHGDGIITSEHNWDSPWASYLEFIGNNVHNNGPSGSQLYHGIYVGTSNNLIDSNISHDNSGFGIQVDNNVNPDWRPASNNTIRNNILYSNGTGGVGGAGLIVAFGTNNTIYNNVIYNNAGGGILVYANSSNTSVYNNSIYGNLVYPGIRVQFIEGDATIRNNIIYLNESDSIVNENSIGGAVIQDHNLTANPMFVNAGSADFHLQSSSPARSTGIDVGVTTDITGYPQTTPPTIGAYVYH